MPRNKQLLLEDILDSITKIESYLKGLNIEEFAQRQMVIDAVIRNLEIIGEAIKSLPSEIKSYSPETEWKKIAGLRDILIHIYFGIDLQIIWDLATSKVIGLKKQIQNIISKISQENNKK